MRPNLLVLGLLGGCTCGPPWVAVDCLATGLTVALVDADGAPVQADAIRAFQDSRLVDTSACTPLGDDCQSALVPVTAAGAYRVEADVGGETFAVEVIVQAADLDADGCCAGFREQRELVVTGAIETCAALDVETCARAPSCAVLAGWAVQGDCVDYDDAHAYGCGDADVGCDTVLTLARPPEGDCVVFPDSCIPAGFLVCEGPIPEECAG